MIRPTVRLDECVDTLLAPALRQRGRCLATTVAAEGIAGADDASLLAFAHHRGYVVLTHDQQDFWRLHRAHEQAGKPHGGIVVIPASFGSGYLRRMTLRADMSLVWLQTELGQGPRPFVRWGTVQYLLTQGRRLPGYSEAEIRYVLGGCR